MPGTEDNNERTREINSWSAPEVLEFIHMADLDAFDAITESMPSLEKAVEGIMERIARGGRVIYAGAGTSGRLAAQDVAELRPTYGIGPDMFDCIMAGGEEAISRSVEGAEDDREAPVKELMRKNLSERDTLVGITASGSTPYVLAALEYANSIGALTVGITNNAGRPIGSTASISVVLDTGPEVIQGSTRMKAGTSQKMVLTMISTTVAVLSGHTYKNTMSKMGAWYNEKLRNRAVRMVVHELGMDEDSARKLLEEHSYRISEVFSAAVEKEEDGTS